MPQSFQKVRLKIRYPTTLIQEVLMNTLAVIEYDDFFKAEEVSFSS
jgi:hypothetical protein